MNNAVLVEGYRHGETEALGDKSLPVPLFATNPTRPVIDTGASEERIWQTPRPWHDLGLGLGKREFYIKNNLLKYEGHISQKSEQFPPSYTKQNKFPYMLGHDNYQSLLFSLLAVGHKTTVNYELHHTQLPGCVQSLRDRQTSVFSKATNIWTE